MTSKHTILVVDDDPDVLEVAAGILAEPRHEVLTASDGYEAIRTLGERQIDLMITDVRMPGIDAFQLCILAKSMQPRLHIIVTTAYPGTSAVSRLATLGGFLPKPFGAVALRQAVKDELRE